MNEPEGASLIAYLDAMIGGAGTVLVAAVVSRLAYHGQQVRRKERPMFGWNLVFEAPIAVGMALVGDAASDYLGLSHHASVGVVAVLAWIGPNGAQALLDRWVYSKLGGRDGK